MSLPSYEQFRQALTDPAARTQIGLVIADADAQSLLTNEEWARNYFDSWIAMAAPAPAAPAPEAPTAVLPAAPEAPAAPATPSPFSSAPTEAFAPAPASPFSAPSAPSQASYPAAPQQGYAAPQQGYAAPQQQGYAAPQGGQQMPQGQMPKKKGLPGWALGLIIGGAALVLLGAIGIGVFVFSVIGASESNNASSSSSEEPGGAATPEADEPATGEDGLDTDAPASPFGDVGADLDYSEADAASYLAVAGPAYGLEASEYIDQEFIDETLITAGESVCWSLDAGISESELSESLDSAGLEAGAGADIVGAAKQYLCN